jgi:acetoin utilization deacetylase AcuC-like enzyme
MVHELIKAFGLLSFFEVRCSKTATKEDLLTFHSRTYLDYLENSSLQDLENGESYTRSSEQEEFGLGWF